MKYLTIQIVTILILSDSMHFLRSQQEISQQKVADSLLITRVRYAKYEDFIQAVMNIFKIM
ncbi:hypothetical protein [Soonwooa buanensis]|uniref:hypothetical protein n=1 Tax=Soonwooa buanensis TaxID=619805 RepID=UPI0009A7468E|nr:hypothetical protein [Soonwooa buanensis]